MKKINLFYFLCLLTLTFSCGGDDDVTPSDADEIVGAWDLSSFEYDFISVTSVPGEDDLSISGTGVAKDISATLDFDANPNEYTSGGSYTITLTSEFYGYETEQDFVIEDFLGLGTWSRDGNTLTATNADGETSEVTILELTDSLLSFDLAIERVISQDGFVVRQTVSGMYSFTR